MTLATAKMVPHWFKESSRPRGSSAALELAPSLLVIEEKTRFKCWNLCSVCGSRNSVRPGAEPSRSISLEKCPSSRELFELLWRFCLMRICEVTPSTFSSQPIRDFWMPRRSCSCLCKAAATPVVTDLIFRFRTFSSYSRYKFPGQTVPRGNTHKVSNTSLDSICWQDS